jgi:hypothetical protein
MQAFLCITKNYKDLEALLLAFVENEIPGGTVLEGRGMAKILCEGLPIFSHLTSFFPDASQDSYVFLSIVLDEQLDLCFRLAKELCGERNRGIVFSLPIGRFESLALSTDLPSTAPIDLKPDSPIIK